MEVLIIDPDVDGSRYLSFVLHAAGYSDPHHVCTGRNALDQLDRTEFGVVVTEISLPDMDIVGLLEALHLRHYQGPVIAVSESAAVGDRVRAFECGADDFIAKPVDPSEFLARLAAVTHRYHYEDGLPTERTLRVGDVELSLKDMTFTVDRREPVRLTPTELRLVECLMRNADVAIFRDTLVDRIWGYDVFGDSNRLDVYVRRLRQKIELDPGSPEYLVTVRTVGYAFRSHEQSFPDGSDYVLSDWENIEQIGSSPMDGPENTQNSIEDDLEFDVIVQQNEFGELAG